MYPAIGRALSASRVQPSLMQVYLCFVLELLPDGLELLPDGLELLPDGLEPLPETLELFFVGL